MSQEHLIDIEELTLDFADDTGRAQVLDAISLTVDGGEIVGLVGESGSGKSVTAATLLRLLPSKGWSIRGGVRVLGENVLEMPERVLENFRGARISMIFQDPANALNPLLRIGAQLAGVIRRHHHLARGAALARAQALLADMQIHDPRRVMRSYPFMLSGGMRQRVLIAMAFACAPAVLVADEPTTALDVTVQAKILRLLRDRARKLGTAILLITHDMAVVRHLCDRVYVIHAGQIVERGPTADVLEKPAHPYTRSLLSALLDRHLPRQPIATLPITSVSFADAPPGCRFSQRCPLAHEACRIKPDFKSISERHEVACWAVQEAAGG